MSLWHGLRRWQPRLFLADWPITTATRCIATDYCMQCCLATTRECVNRAHCSHPVSLPLSSAGQATSSISWLPALTAQCLPVATVATVATHCRHTLIIVNAVLSRMRRASTEQHFKLINHSFVKSDDRGGFRGYDCEQREGHILIDLVV